MAVDRATANWIPLGPDIIGKMLQYVGQEAAIDQLHSHVKVMRGALIANKEYKRLVPLIVAGAAGTGKYVAACVRACVCSELSRAWVCE